MTFPPGTPETGWAIPEEGRVPEWGDRQQVGPLEGEGKGPRRDEGLTLGTCGDEGPVREAGM